jgi:hypothetical protein
MSCPFGVKLSIERKKSKNAHHLEKQKPEPGQSDLENSSLQDQSTFGLSRLDVEDVFPQSQSTAEPYLTK